MLFTQTQRDIIVGTVLGDATLERNGKNVRMKTAHCIKQKEYVKWKYNYLKHICSSLPRVFDVFDKRTQKIRQQISFSTKTMAELNVYRELFYKDKIKIIPDNITEMLTSPLSLAVWYMDDGHKRTDCNALRLHTNSYSFEEQMKLKKCLSKNFDIDVNIHKAAKHFVLYVPSREGNKFCSIVKPYIIPSLQYKIFLTL
tara:strand:- start:241 stop:837 length:597 start_codon:yes stop_codon:yes gene_type:complete